MSGAQRVLLGWIASVHGIRGDVLVKTHTGDPADIARYGALTDAAGERPLELAVRRVTSKGLIAHIRGIEDRTAAEALRGAELWVARERLPKAEAGEFYYVDLIGLEAVDEAGTPFGKVTNVVNYGGGDLLEVALLDGGKRELVPFKLTFVPEVDIAAARVVIAWPLQFEIVQNEHLSGDGDDGD